MGVPENRLDPCDEHDPDDATMRDLWGAKPEMPKIVIQKPVVDPIDPNAETQEIEIPPDVPGLHDDGVTTAEVDRWGEEEFQRHLRGLSLPRL